MPTRPGRKTVADLDSSGASLARARNLLAAAMQNAERAAIAAATDGVPESVIARRIGVNRLTVRKWLGK